MRQDNEGPQLLGPLNRPTVQVWPFLSGAEANPLFLETLELSPGNFRNSPGKFRNSPGNFRNSLALYFQFQGQKDILRETPGKPGQEIAKPNRLSWEGGPSTHPSPKRVILSALLLSKKIWKDVRRRIPKNHIKNMLAHQRLLRQQR